MEYEDDEEATSQCCSVPKARRRKHFQDNSTIIEFVPVPMESAPPTPVLSPVMQRKNVNNVENNVETRLSSTQSLYNATFSHQQPRYHPLVPDTRGQVIPMFLDNIGPSYVDIPQPSNVIIQRNSTIFSDSVLSISDSVPKYDERNSSSVSTNDSLLLHPRSGSLSSHSHVSLLTDSATTMNSSGYKFKSHLLVRYSAEVEEENRVLRQMLRIRYLDSQIMLNKSFY